MNVYVVSGGSRQRAITSEAIKFFGKELMPRLYYKLDINVELVRKLAIKEGIEGDVMAVDDYSWPKYFDMRLNATQSPDEFIRTIAHEMVHIKQYAKNELYDYSHSNLIRWKDRKINTKRYKNYGNLPWELEADKLTEPLYIKWKEKYQK
jgi:hypothetical protein